MKMLVPVNYSDHPNALRTCNAYRPHLKRQPPPSRSPAAIWSRPAHPRGADAVMPILNDVEHRPTLSTWNLRHTLRRIDGHVDLRPAPGVDARPGQKIAREVVPPPHAADDAGDGHEVGAAVTSLAHRLAAGQLLDACQTLTAVRQTRQPLCKVCTQPHAVEFLKPFQKCDRSHDLTPCFYLKLLLQIIAMDCKMRQKKRLAGHSAPHDSRTIRSTGSMTDVADSPADLGVESLDQEAASLVQPLAHGGQRRAQDQVATEMSS